MSPMSPADEHFAEGRRFDVSDSAWRAIQFEHGGGMSSSVDVLPFVDRPRLNMVIGAVIMVERATQKGILIGHKGSALKRVGTEARKDLETFFDKKVFLELFVKVNKNWRNDARQLRRFGYDSK